MKESDLQKGDVIFFRNNYKDASGGLEYSYIDHVGLFAGHNEEGHPLIIHSISSSIGHYEPTSQSGLCISTLRALKDRVQVEEGYPDKLYDVSFHVLRTKLAPSLAIEALSILEQQARFRIPYDEKRLAEKVSREDRGMTDTDFKNMGEANYRTDGIYRSIKYAARYPLPLTRTRVDGVGRGLTCSMCVVLAFQIAELRQKGLTTSVSDFPDAWVSDKYSPDYAGLVSPDIYKAYLGKLKDMSTRTEARALLSYSFWVRKEPTPETFSHQTLPVDAKIIGAAGLFLHMSENAAWINMGELEIVDRVFDAAAKLHERRRRTESFTSALECLDEVVKGRESALSSSRSTTPFTPLPSFESSLEGFAKEPRTISGGASITATGGAAATAVLLATTAKIPASPTRSLPWVGKMMSILMPAARYPLEPIIERHGDAETATATKTTEEKMKYTPTAGMGK
jgi:hypothetical protein